MKYRRESTPNIKFQADRIFVRNDLFEQVIRRCKATNIEFLMFKEKLGKCLYEENYYEGEIIKIQDEESTEKIVKVPNKKSTKKLIEESDNESNNKSDNESDNESIKGSDNKTINESDNHKESEEESIKDLKELSSLNNKSTTNWYDKNKFNKILTTIDNNNFNHKNKIGKLKFNDINELITNIKNNTISEADTKKKINKLNKIKNVETKGKQLIKNQEKLLSLFDDLKTIFNNNNNTERNNKNENKNVNENENDEYYYEIRQLNDWFITNDQTKSLEEQIELLKEETF